MTTLAVFGHKKPDTDAIVAAMAMSYWLNQQNIAATPYRLDAINHETAFLIDLAHVRTPTLLTHIEAGQQVALVDHNERQQSIGRVEEAHICYVIDHHKLGDLTTTAPAYIRFEPVGSTCTVLYGMFLEKQLPISQQMALLMAGAIISDTLNLTSPTTTNQDKGALSALLHLAGMRDADGFANQLFEAKSTITGITDEALVTMDYKQFGFADSKWGIAAIETVNPNQVFARIDGLQQAAQAIEQRDHLDFLLVIIVDIIQQQSWAIAGSDAQNHIVTQAFASSLDKNLIALGNRVSRKQQFVPALAAFYALPH
ncbi:MAG: manganese-dependent inorganic pyrophosphatase [Moraxella sp.]|jgi:manganese-dependent inorganic pyrophosphatase